MQWHMCVRLNQKLYKSLLDRIDLLAAATRFQVHPTMLTVCTCL